jgi:hypothetical protein
VLISIGWAILHYAIKMAARVRQRSSWPSTEGEIAHSAVLCQTDTWAATRRPTPYKADISYRYKVNGANYSSSRISLLDLAFSTADRAQRIVGRYPDKARVRVYYNPADCSEAVLEPGSADGISFLYVVGGTFAAVGVFFLIMSLTGHVHMGS